MYSVILKTLAILAALAPVILAAPVPSPVGHPPIRKAVVAHKSADHGPDTATVMVSPSLHMLYREQC
jgi:hypothetical protein